MVPRVPTRLASRGLPETLMMLLLGATVLRFLGSVIAGVIALTTEPDFPQMRERAANILTAFGSAGDTTTVLVVLAAAALLVWGRPRPRGEAFGRLIQVFLLMVAVLVLARVAGVFLIDVDLPAQVQAQEAFVAAFGAGDLLLCAGGAILLGRVEAVAAAEATDDLEPLVFAVDRGNGEVFAFFSYAQAVRAISIYSIEEDEFAFYADDGTAINAEVVDERTRFTPTDVDARDELMQHLRRFAKAKSLDVVDPTDATSYAVPIADWQWLELWPGWLRGIARVVRRLRG